MSCTSQKQKNDLIPLCSCSNNMRYVCWHCDFCPAKCLPDNVVTYPFECSTHRVYSRNKPMRVKWAPFCNFRGPFFKKRNPPKGIWTYWYRLFREKTNAHWRFAATLEHSGQLEMSGLELLQNPGCLSGEIMTQKKKRKAIERVRGYESSK